jgi:hypothetical protein
MRRSVAPLALALFILTAAVPAVAVSPNTEYRTRQIFDAAVLRPLGFVQLVTGAVMFVLTYPVSWATDYTEEMKDICYRWPVNQTFERPLGDLRH